MKIRLFCLRKFIRYSDIWHVTVIW